MGEWQPIETAPKDGKPLLTFGSLHDDNGADMGETPRVQYSRWDYKTSTWYSDEWGTHQPTHWQPLPAPPAAQRDMQEVGG